MPVLVIFTPTDISTATDNFMPTVCLSAHYADGLCDAIDTPTVFLILRVPTDSASPISIPTVYLPMCYTNR